MANVYNFTRDGITFAYKPMDQAKGLSYQPTHGSTDWGRVVSGNEEINPMFHAVEIDWDGAVVNGQTINTTGQLLKKIADLEAKCAALEGAITTLAQNVGALVTIANG